MSGAAICTSSLRTGSIIGGMDSILTLRTKLASG